MSGSRLQRERIAVTLDDGRQVDVERVRDPRARRLKLLVGEQGRVRLTVPRGASPGEADAFLRQHRAWLAGQLRRLADEPTPAGLFDSTDGVPLRDAMVPLRWASGRYARYEFDDAGLLLVVPDAASSAAASRLLREFYAAQARADIGRWLPRYLPGLPRAPSAFRLRPLRSLWGSLSPDDSVSLDLSLVLGSPAAFEYVLVHELCHLIQRNHRPAFWQEVEARCPDWRRQRDYLRGDGMMLKRRLYALLG